MSESREAVLRRYGAGDESCARLISYCDGSFSGTAVTGDLDLPLSDEPHVETWRGYVADAEAAGVFDVLRAHLPQLRFPIASGMSDDRTYRAATRRGEPASAEGRGLVLEAPAELRLFIHATPAGAVPVIEAARRADFVAIAQALRHRNEPHEIPDAMGAMALSGYNNWDRVFAIRDAWSTAGAPADATWQQAFAAVSPAKRDYQDAFIVLSRGPYSHVPAEAVGLSESEWLTKSSTIRLEHECTHYFTRRVFGSMNNHLQDELIADYAGIVAAEGRYRADWFLRFLGITADGSVGDDGRFGIYCPETLTPDDRAVLARLTVAAAHRVEATNAHLPDRARASADELLALCRCSLDDLAQL